MTNPAQCHAGGPTSSFETVRQIRQRMERPRVSFADEAVRRAGADGAASSAQNPVQPALAGQQMPAEEDNSHTKDQAAGMADGDTGSTLHATSEGLSATEAQDEGVLHTHAMAQCCPPSSVPRFRRRRLCHSAFFQRVMHAGCISFSPVQITQSLWGLARESFLMLRDMCASRPGGQVAWQHRHVLVRAQGHPSAEAQQAITVWSVQQHGWQRNAGGQGKISGEPQK